jgi:hypothetical protein
LAEVVVIQAEVEFLPLYRGQPLFSEVELFLRGQGFRLHRFFPMVSRAISPVLVNANPYAGLSQLVWADAVFVRDIAAPGRFTERQLLAGAALLHDCYASHDLVFHLLAEHDRREGGRLAATYLAGLQATLAEAA